MYTDPSNASSSFWGKKFFCPSPSPRRRRKPGRSDVSGLVASRGVAPSFENPTLDLARLVGREGKVAMPEAQVANSFALVEHIHIYIYINVRRNIKQVECNRHSWNRICLVTTLACLINSSLFHGE